MTTSEREMTELNLHKFGRKKICIPYKLYWSQIAPLGTEIRRKMNLLYLLEANKLSTVYSNITYLMLIHRVNLNQDNGFTQLFFKGGEEGGVRLLFKVNTLKTPWGGNLGHPVICNAKSTTRRLQETYLSQWRGCTRYEATHTYDKIILFQGFFWRGILETYCPFFFLLDWNTIPKSMKH